MAKYFVAGFKMIKKDERRRKKAADGIAGFENVYAIHEKLFKKKRSFALILCFIFNVL